MYQKLFLSFFEDKDFKGRLKIEFDGRIFEYGKNQSEEGLWVKEAYIKVIDKNFFKSIIVYGDIGLGEAYFRGEFQTDDLRLLLLWFVQNQDYLPSFNTKKISYFVFEWSKLISSLAHRLNKNTKKGSLKNIHEHYDVSNDFYKLWLDETMTYSSAVFENTSSLKTAQENKYKKICEKICLREKDHLLEIGSGWGGFAIFAVSNYNCRLTTITISKEQYDFALSRINSLGLGDKIDIKFLDYRDLSGEYDKIVSIEMMEALGHEYVPVFINKIYSLLGPDAKTCLQCITYPDQYFDNYLKKNNFIKKHIFPGGELISLAGFKKELAKYKNFNISSVESIGRDYARTLRIWRNNFTAQKKAIISLGYDEEFYRKWYYYFVYCEVAFETGYLDDVQILIES